MKRSWQVLIYIYLFTFSFILSFVLPNNAQISLISLFPSPDTFFKKPEYYNRFTIEDVRNMINSRESFFLLAIDSEDKSKTKVVGSIFVVLVYDWKPVFKSEVGNPRVIRLRLTGRFSAVSVVDRCTRRGIGKKLVSAAESYAVEYAHDMLEKERKHRVEDVFGDPNMHIDTRLNVYMEMGVINARADLFPWYQNQGYIKLQKLPNDKELERICSDTWKHIHCILMRKELLIDDFDLNNANLTGLSCWNLLKCRVADLGCPVEGCCPFDHEKFK